MWEYNIVHNCAVHELNEYGEQGWEVIQQFKNDGNTWSYLMKRKIIS